MEYGVMVVTPLFGGGCIGSNPITPTILGISLYISSNVL